MCQQGQVTSQAACIISLVSLNGFYCNICFKHPSQSRFEEQSCTKPSTCGAPKCSDSDSWHAAHEITEIVHRTVESLCFSCCLQVLKISEKFLPLSKTMVKWSYKTMFLPAIRSHGCLDHPCQDLVPLLFCMHSLFCQSVGLILNSSLYN